VLTVPGSDHRAVLAEVTVPQLARVP
jgi:hypothetical protein